MKNKILYGPSVSLPPSLLSRWLCLWATSLLLTLYRRQDIVKCVKRKVFYWLSKKYKIWVYSDPHFHHTNICKFADYKGDPLRPWDDVDKMTSDLISMYNELVSDEDRVYILGDVAFNANKLRESVSQLKGRKVLVPGNHEPPKMRKYFDVFDDVRVTYNGRVLLCRTYLFTLIVLSGGV